MNWIILISAFFVLLAMALLLFRAIKGPTLPDRILAVNSFGTKTVALVVLITLLYGDTMLIDVALVYAIINFITTLALLKYFERGSFKE